MGCEKLNENEVAEVITKNVALEEAKKVDERWSKAIESIGKIKDKFKRSCICLLLENQRLMNEASTSTEMNSPETKKKLIDLAAAVYPNLLAWNLVSVQPLVGPTGLIYHLSRRISPVNNEPMLTIDSQDIVARTRRLKRQVCDDFGPKDVAQAVIDDLDTEVLKDLSNNCATVGCVNLKAYKSDKAVRLAEALESVIKDAKEKFNEKMFEGCEPNWMVVNDKLHRRLKPAFDSLDLCKNLSIYPHKGVEGVLIGRKGESYMDSGYVLSPYVPFTLTPAINFGIFGLLTRYGKKLLPNGASYYSRVTVFDDVPEEE